MLAPAEVKMWQTAIQDFFSRAVFSTVFPGSYVSFVSREKHSSRVVLKLIVYLVIVSTFDPLFTPVKHRKYSLSHNVSVKARPQNRC